MIDTCISTGRASATTLLLALAVAAPPTQPAAGCSTVMVGRQATADGSVLMASSCDGDVMGLIYIMPAETFPPGTKVPMYWNVPRPRNYNEYRDNLRKGYDLVGYLPVEKTCRTMIMAGNVENMTTGGLNEHGLSIAIEFLPMREGLACDKGVVGPNSNHWTTSLIANGLRRARTAREAIRLIGSMVDEYGFLYYRAPAAGVALPIADKNEIWLMEIFGPGNGWTPANGKPGGVWCAQRIPDGEVGCSANRSRIGEVDLNDPSHFIASANIHTLAQELGFWRPGGPFIWYDVYGGPGSTYNSMREWRALSLAAPSLGLKATGDPAVDRYPFSVKPDKPIDVPALFRTMRDGYEGTEFDLTEHPAFRIGENKCLSQNRRGLAHFAESSEQNVPVPFSVGGSGIGSKSPLARPWGPDELFDLLHVKPNRALCTPTSGYVFVAQLRDRLPDPIGACLWFAYGPASTSCFVPIYAGVSELPDTWNQPANFTRIDREQPQWNFRLVHNLVNHLRYQESIRDVQRVIMLAEAGFLAAQADLEKTALQLFEQKGAAATEAFLTDRTHACLSQVETAYQNLVDYLMFRYLVGNKELAPPKLPQITVPAVPENVPLPVSEAVSPRDSIRVHNDEHVLQGSKQ